MFPLQSTSLTQKARKTGLLMLASIMFILISAMHAPLASAATASCAVPDGVNATGSNASSLITYTTTPATWNANLQSQTVGVNVTAKPNCNVTVSLAAYNAAGPAWESSLPQLLTAKQTATLTGGQSATLTVPVSSCYYQTDFVFGNVLDGDELNNNVLYGDDKIKWDNGGNRSCYASPAKAITPVFECSNLVNSSLKTYQAYYGYNNPNSVINIVPFGDANELVGTTLDGSDAQVGIFMPGRISSQFQVYYRANGSSTVQWNLGSLHTSAAKTPACAAAPAIAITSAPITGTTATTANFKFSALGANYYTCTLDNNPTQPCQNGTFTSTGLALGSHSLIINAFAPGANPSTKTYTWNVSQPILPPTITVPANITAYASGPNGALVSFAASGVDMFGAVLGATCDHPSGSLFPLGNTTVTCSVTAALGGTITATFKVTVLDNQAPVITVADPVTATVASPAGGPVSLPVTATDNVDGTVAVTCNPADGTTLAPGTYTVTCSARDAAGNTASKSFTLKVVYSLGGANLPVKLGDAMTIPGTGYGWKFNNAPTNVTAQNNAAGNGATYAATDYTVIDTSLFGTFKEDVKVNAHAANNTRTFSWTLTHPAGDTPTKNAQGAIVMAKARVLPLVLTDTAGNALPAAQQTSWTLSGDTITATINEAGLPASYIVDPTTQYSPIVFPTYTCVNSTSICATTGNGGIEGLPLNQTTGATNTGTSAYLCTIPNGSTSCESPINSQRPNVTATAADFEENANNNLPISEGYRGWAYTDANIHNYILPAQPMLIQGEVAQIGNSNGEEANLQIALRARIWKVTMSGNTITSAIPLSDEKIGAPQVVHTTTSGWTPLTISLMPNGSYDDRHFNATNEYFYISLNYDVQNRSSALANRVIFRTNSLNTFVGFALPPAAPSVAISSSQPATTESSNVTLTRTITGGDPERVSCALDSAALAICPAASTSQDFTGLTVGTHTYRVVAENAGGTSDKTYTWTITAAPTAILTSGPAAGATTGPAVHFDFTTTNAATVTCKVDTGAASACTTSKDLTGLTDGSHTFTVTATSSAGTVATATRTWNVVNAPTVTLTSTPVDGTTATTANFAWTTTGTVDTTTCKLDSATAAACTSPKSLTGLSLGLHTFVVTVTNVTGSASKTFSWTVAEAAPTVAITAPAAGATTGPATSVTWTQSANAVSATCKLDSGTAAVCTSPKALTGLADGSHTVTVVVTNSSGATATASRTWNVVNAPTVAFTSTPVDGTTDTTANFAWTTTGTVDTTTCKLDSATATACTSPKALSGLSVGSHTFTVNVTNVTGTATKSFTWNVANPLANTAVPTVSGSTELGNTLHADKGTWTSAGAVSYTYQWQRCDSTGTICTDIVGATGTDYTTTSADLGDTIRVIVTATSGGVTKIATSSVTTGTVADTTAPTTTLALTKGTNPAAQYINGNTVYINGTLGGSFTVTANATDNGTGVGNVAFPDLNPAGGTTGSANPTLDPTFGNGGTSVTNPYNAPGSNVGFQQSGLQSNGKIIITGQVYDPNIAGPYGQGTYGFFAARYNADGSLDTTFGNNGSFFNTITGYSFSNSVNVGVDDSITLVGSNGTNGDPIVVRLTANGALDTTFGNGQGYVSFPGLTGNTYFYPQTSAVDSQGRVILVGQAQDATSGNSTLAIKRLLANGNVDTSFGPNGIFTYTNAAYPQGVYPQGRITIQGADKIIVGNIAYYNNYSSYDGLLIRVNSNGTVDTTFGSNGAVTLVKGYFNGVKAGFNGSLVARVYNNYNGNSGDALVRYSADGVLDTTFGTNGNVSLENAGQSVSDFIVRSNGNIAATTQGYNYTTNQYESRVMQLDVNGAVLNSSDAVTVGTYFSPQEIVEQNDGRLVIIGYAQDANGNAALGMAGLRTATPKYWAPIGGQTVTTAPYAVTYSWTPGAGGATNAQVVATDTTGNAATKAFNVVTDNAKPTVSITGPAGSNLNGTVTLTGIAADADAGLSGVVVTVDGNAVTCTGNFSCVINGAALAEGSHTIVATATDNVGNTKTATKVMFVDHTAPVLGLAVTASGTSVTVTPSATDNGSGFASGTVTYSGPANGTACTIDQGLAPCTWDASALPSGTYTLTFNGVDSAGNAATPVTKTVSIDAVAPTATVANLPATVTGIVTISGTAKDNIAVDNAKLCYTGPSSACVTLTVDAAGNWTTNVDTNPLPNGTYTFTLTVTDTAGNTKTATQTTNVANPVPAVGITAPLPNQEFTDATGLQGTFVLAQGTATSVSCQVRLGSVNGSLVKNITSCASPVDLSSLAVTGTPYYFVVTAANAAGSDTENVVFKVGKAPAVTITAGPADNAEVRDNAVQYSFTLDGATTAQCRLDNFPQTTACSGTFNTANAMYANQQIYGSLGAGNHTVTITASNAVGSASKTMHFTIPSQAVITSNPSTGPAFAQNDNFGNYGGSYAIYPRASHAYQAIKLLKENADGSMLVLGHDFVGGRDASGAYYNTYAVVIFKLKADLTMDTSYGTNGVLTVQNPATVNDPYPQLITSSGNHIYSVASGANYSMTAMTVRRWNFDGTEDTSFHSNVDMSAALAANHTYGSFTALKEDSDGHVIISATVITGSDYNNNDAILVRLNSDGSADTSFGDNGQSDIIQAVRSAGCSSSADYRRYSATDWAQETDGSYIVAGGGFSPCYRAMASYHMLANGHLDSTFGSGGATIATSTFGYSQGLRVDLVDNGTKFMVAGGNLASATVAKYNIDGTPDNTFNVNGDFNSHHYKELWDQGDHTCLAATQVTRDSQGRYYFFGTCPYGSNYNQHNFLSDYQYGIGRTTPSGDVDLSYGNSNNGISLVTPSDLPAATYAAGNDYPGSMSHYIGLDLLSNGRPLMTGERDVNGSAQALVRTQIAPDVEWVTAPNLTMTSGPAEGDTIGSYLHFEYKIAGNDPNPGITCSLVDGNGNTVPAGGCTSPIDVAGLADGTYTLTVSAAGSLGNGMGSIVRHFTVAAGTGSAPTAAFASGPADGGEVIATNATYGVSSSNATWTLCAVNNGPFKACDTSYKFTGLVAGANTVRIRAVNRNGVTNVTRSVTVFKASGMIYYSSYVNNSNAPYRSMDSLGQNNTSQGFSVWNGTNGYAISPNGRYLAVIRTVDGSGGLGGNTTQIYLYDLVNHTSSVVTSAYVTTGSGFPLRWNESSTKFSYITQPNPMTSATRYAYVYDVAAQTSTLVYGDDYYIFSVNFYPNSTDLLIDRGYYGYYRHTESMPTYNAGTYVMGNNSQGGDYEYISDLRFAPGDPNTVFYTSYDTNTNESILIRRNLTTNVKTEIVRSNTLNGWDISNDGTKVAYSMGYAGSANAGTFVASAVDGSGATLVAKALGQQNQPNYQPRFSPDGKMVAFGSQGGQDVSYVWQIAVVRVTGVDADNPAIAATTNSSDASNLAWR